MSLQQNIRNSFGQSNYFENKDQLRQEVNEFIRGKRTEKAIGRNLRRGFRAKIGSKENNAAMELYNAAIKMGIEDPDGGGGFGMEAGRARKFAEFTLNRNFEEEQKRKRELEARTGGAPAAGQQNAGVQPVIGANSVLKPEAGVVNPQQGQQKSVLTKPDWAKDVENDKTFPKGFFDDPANLARIQGKSRAEVAEMLNKAKAARFMAGATARGNEMEAKELAEQALNQQSGVLAADKLNPEQRARLNSIYANPALFNEEQATQRNSMMATIQWLDQAASNTDAYADAATGAEINRSKVMEDVFAKGDKARAESAARSTKFQKGLEDNLRDRVLDIRSTKAQTLEPIQNRIRDIDKQQKAADRAFTRDNEYYQNKSSVPNIIKAIGPGISDTAKMAERLAAESLETGFDAITQKNTFQGPKNAFQKSKNFIQGVPQNTFQGLQNLMAPIVASPFTSKVVKHFTY